MTAGKDRPPRALLWTGVSTPEQAKDEKQSLRAQKQVLTEICQQKGYEIFDILEVPGFSRDYLDIHEWAKDAAAQGIDAGLKLLRYMNDPIYRKPEFDVFVFLDGDRFGRTQSLLTRIAETISMKLHLPLYSHHDGLIEPNHARMWISMVAYKSASEIDRLKEKRKIGMPARAKKGKALARKKTHLYRAVYHDGEEIGIEIDRSKQTLWNDLATLILAGVSWNKIEAELFTRFGHVHPATGRPYANRTFYDIVHTPVFWGHSAWNYRPKGGRNRTKTGFWVFDSSELPPDGVQMYYNTHEAVYNGELAEQIKAELRRRRLAVKGKINPQRTFRFSGLLVCNKCGYNLSWIEGGSGYQGYRCMSHFYPYYPHRASCLERKSISVARVQKWLDARLRQMLAVQDLTPLTRNNEAENTHAVENIEDLRKEIMEMERVARNLVLRQATAPEGLQATYDETIKDYGDRLLIKKTNLKEMERSQAESREMNNVQQFALKQLLEISMDNFWKLEEREINQMLHRLLANNRLAVQDGQIVGIRKAVVKRRQR
jgi:hypothetical protein